MFEDDNQTQSPKKQGRTPVESPNKPYKPKPPDMANSPPPVPKPVPKPLPTQAKSPHHWIMVFGRPGCGYTSGAVDGLVRDGRFPFVYLSMPGDNRQAWWGFVSDFLQKRAADLVLPRTFPTVLVWDPKPVVLQSDGLKKYLDQKDLDPSKFASNLLRARAAERARTDDRSASDLVRNGVDFVWQPDNKPE